MVAGHLQVKKGYYYIVLSYRDYQGKRIQPWIPIGLTEKGNKKKAEAKLIEARTAFEIPKAPIDPGKFSSDMLFADFMRLFLSAIKESIELSTYSGYLFLSEKKIEPYFRNLGIRLNALDATHIQNFYIHELQQISSSSVLHEHALIHRALKYAVKIDLLQFNAADRVDRPKKIKYTADYLKVEELDTLFESCKDHPYALIIQMTAFYGFRRSEIIGLKWDAIDFERNTITVKHVVTQMNYEGKRIMIEKDRGKNKASNRSLPLLGDFRERLLEIKSRQEENKRICGSCYNKKYDGYVFVTPMGDLIKPDTLSDAFSRMLEKAGLRHVRFHDLRHSCASLLLANKVPMKQIQEWLGHSDIGTTSNIYAHLEFQSKIESANVMDHVLKLPEIHKKSDWM